MDEGIALIREGIAGLLKTGSRLGVSRHAAWLAMALEYDGRVMEAFETMEEALHANPDELFYRPEILRINGEFHLNKSSDRIGRGRFPRIPHPRRKDGRQGMGTSYHNDRLRGSCATRTPRGSPTMLSVIYSWFTEGFDTPDLIDAKALLDELKV